MVKRMLIDAAHPEEIRVVVIDGHRVEDFDFETASKRPIKGNIYLAKVTRVEPSLQAAFIDYGGNRHGFLAFNEVHPDYYRVPVGDRQALLAQDDDNVSEPVERDRDRDRGRRRRRHEPRPRSDAGLDAASFTEFQPPQPDDVLSNSAADDAPDRAAQPPAEPVEPGLPFPDQDRDLRRDPWATPAAELSPPWETPAPGTRLSDFEPGRAFEPTPANDASPEGSPHVDGAAAAPPAGDRLDLGQPANDVTTDAPVVEPIERAEPSEGAAESDRTVEDDPADAERRAAEAAAVEAMGGEDEVEDDAEERRHRHRLTRHYKIQEVIKRRQVMLVQAVKEERGTKGAALTTYLSLAGRYCVLMPNTARGGGISRRIANPADRKRLKAIMDDLEVPEGMAVILRTAGLERSKPEIRRDYEYLMRLWDEIRELTLKSVAPSLIYEEGNLIKRAIRDLYSRDIDEVLVEGEEAHEAARAFMRTLMPDHEDRIRLYRDPAIPLYQRFSVEQALDEIHQPDVRLRSGGYIVINPTEALVAIDVNSGRSTRERHIEETALKTNVEAAEEIARQIRLRDLAGLIVIDFIDMEDHRHQAQVERRLKEAMKNDRARIQIGRISAFGLLEMSRQRLRPSLVEASSELCPHCGGTGHIRSTGSSALHVLRALEEEGSKARAGELVVHVATPVALYLLNQKRGAVTAIETRYGLRIIITADDALIPPAYRIERTKARAIAPETVAPIRQVNMDPVEAETEAEDEPVESEATGAASAPAEGEDRLQRDDAERRGGRRRRRRGGRNRSERSEGGASPIPLAPGAPEQAGGTEAGTPLDAPGGTAEPIPLIYGPGHEPGGPLDRLNLLDPQEDAEDAAEPEAPEDAAGGAQADGRGARRRRGRRGGRRRRRDGFEPRGEGVPATDAPADPADAGAADTGLREDPSRALAYPLDAPLGAPDSPLPHIVPREPDPAHDWPWNRDNATVAAPPTATAEREPAAQAEAATEPPRVAVAAEPPAPLPAAPEPEAPTVADSRASDSSESARAGRGGWWKRLTGG